MARSVLQRVGSDGWRELDKRRLSLFVLSSIEDSTDWVRYQLQSEGTATRLEHQVRTFLGRLHEKGALRGRTEAQAYAVDVTTGTNELRLRFAFALESRPELASYELTFAAGGANGIRPVPTLEAGGFFR